jgi:hypothetical protein
MKFPSTRIPVAAGLMILLCGASSAPAPTLAAPPIPASAGSTPEAGAAHAPDRFFYMFMVGSTRWPAVHELVPAPAAFSPRFGGRFQPWGWTIELAWQRRVREARGTGVFVGGDFGSFAHGSGWRNVGVDAFTGRPVRGEMFATAGHLTLSGRMVWREGKALTLHCASGAGLYLVRIKDNIEGTGMTETGNHAASPGGYVGAGLDRLVWRRAGIGLHIEGRVHVFEFDDLGPGFPGQRASGPLYQLAGALSFWS